MQDSEIIELYFARDERAITETSDKYGTYCTRIALNILDDSFESDECVNDTYLRAWNSIPPTRPNIFRAFLAKITRNLALDKLSAKNSQKRGGRVFESLDELAECVGSSDITERLESEEIAGIINAFLRSERELVRRIFIRRYFYLDSVADIAKAYRIGEGRVKTVLHRARGKLALYLSKEGIFI
ncbi:MAG: sigma-70 family RNA polymerase sigma factor [Clostridia bacterium]|nr:sigma-70 family RNA polymerase sigma factor [Clostridia bacterium]